MAAVKRGPQTLAEPILTLIWQACEVREVILGCSVRREVLVATKGEYLAPKALVQAHGPGPEARGRFVLRVGGALVQGGDGGLVLQGAGGARRLQEVVPAALADIQVGDGVGIQLSPLLEEAQEGVASLPAGDRLLGSGAAVGRVCELSQRHPRLATELAGQEVALQAELVVFNAGEYAEAQIVRQVGRGG